MRAYIFDLDGTLCNIEHRLHFIKRPEARAMLDARPLGPNDDILLEPEIRAVMADGRDLKEWKADWDGFHAACVGDAPIAPMCQLADTLVRTSNVIFVSGRSEVARKATIEWLKLHVPSLRRCYIRLYMRPDGDHKPDEILKGEMLDHLIASGIEPIMCFDDRKRVVEMWRARGLVCAQVAPGEF